MQFDSLAALVAMGGHGAYVWSAYGVALLALAVNALLPGRRLAALRREIEADAELAGGTGADSSRQGDERA